MLEKSKLNITVFKRLLSYWRSYRTLFLIAVLCTLILAVLGPLRPLVIGYMVNEHIIENPDQGQLIVWTMIIIGMLIFVPDTMLRV